MIDFSLLEVLMVLPEASEPSEDARRLGAWGAKVSCLNDPYREREGNWVERVVSMRNLLKSHVERPFWMSLDPDIRLELYTVDDALSFLRATPEWSGVGIWPFSGEVECGGHVHAACALHRTFDFRDVWYGTTHHGIATCECAVFTARAREQGLRYGNHPGLRCTHGEEVSWD